MENSEQTILKFTLLDDYGDERSIFDFGLLGINLKVAEGLKSAYVSSFTHNSVETQRQCLRYIRKFCFFLKVSGREENSILDKNILIDFLHWLSHLELSEASQGSIFNVIKALILWCDRNCSKILPESVKVPLISFRRDPAKPNVIISNDDLKKILKACYQEINIIEEKIKYNQEQLAANSLGNDTEEVFTLLNQLLLLGEGRIPTKSLISRSKNLYTRRVLKCGGLRSLKARIFLSPSDVFPYYLAILVQTAGNALAVLEMTRNCITPHPLRSDRKTLTWYKRRSGSEQKADFGILKRYSAPNLVESLLKLSENLLPLATFRHKNSLFIAHNVQGAFVPCFQMMHLLLNRFIVKHSLINFDFKQLRSTSAFLHHKEGNDLLVARNKLNHKSVRTTSSYTQPEYFFEENNELIAQLQNEIVSRALNESTVITLIPSCGKAHKTVFGFNCSDPYSGIAPGSRANQLCINFYHCATCPGAIVMLDDPFIIARLKQTNKELEETQLRAMKEGWLERFNEVYLPILYIIQEDLLTKVSPLVLAAAEKIPVPPIPRLE